MFCSVNSLLEPRSSRNRWNSVLTKAEWNRGLTDTCVNNRLDCSAGQSSPSFQHSHLFTMINTNLPQLKHCLLWINLNSLWTDCATRYFCFLLIHFVVFEEQSSLYNAMLHYAEDQSIRAELFLPFSIYVTVRKPLTKQFRSNTLNSDNIAQRQEEPHQVPHEVSFAKYDELLANSSNLMPKRKTWKRHSASL
jgi:hypothetical protein